MSGTSSYIIQGGRDGRARLSVLARVMAASTAALLDRLEPLAGRAVVDAGCGGGDVSFELARRVGPTGRVIGLDMDGEKLDLARAEAAALGLPNIDFIQASVLDPWPAEAVDLVHARFLLTHVPGPEAVLARARAALGPGGAIAVQDIDYAGQFCDPPCEAFDQAGELYAAAARCAGGDPYIGRRLRRLLEDTGFTSIEADLAQPFGRGGDVADLPCLTFDAIGDAIEREALATRPQIQRISRELWAFAGTPGAVLSTPRVFQALGRKLA